MKLKKGDFLAVALVLAAAIGVGLFVAARAGGGAPVAVVVLDGHVLRRIDLNAVAQAQTFSVDGAFHNEILVGHGRIRVNASDCPGGDCVRSGWAQHAGRSIVCLPNRMEIRMEGGDTDVDATAR